MKTTPLHSSSLMRVALTCCTDQVHHRRWPAHPLGVSRAWRRHRRPSLRPRPRRAFRPHRRRSPLRLRPRVSSVADPVPAVCAGRGARKAGCSGAVRRRRSASSTLTLNPELIAARAKINYWKISSITAASKPGSWVMLAPWTSTRH